MSMQFCDATKRYLYRYYEILDAMIDGMNRAETTASVSRDFIVQMLPHHEAAIAMSRNLLEYAPAAPLRQIAQSIIRTQTQSIAAMERALPGCAARENGAEDVALYQRRFRQIADDMFCEMGDAAATNWIDGDYIREMIPHHAGAVRMARNALRYPLCPALPPILEAIIAQQTRGIHQLRRLLRCAE